MGGLLQNIVGGALKGAGEGIVDEAKARREAAITALAVDNRRQDAATQHGYQADEIDQRTDGSIRVNDAQNVQQLDRDSKNHGYRVDESDHDAANRDRNAAKDHARNASDITGTFTADDGAVYGQSRGGLIPMKGVKGNNKGDDDELAHADAIASTSRTVQDADGNKTVEKVIDPNKAIAYLNQRGRGDLAFAYIPPAKLELLKSKPTPEMRKFFDQKYGQGAAARALAVN